MRSLFHFPLPCTTTLAVTVSYSNRPTAPEMSRRPHPAPMRRQRRSPVLLSAARPLPGPALTGPWPTVTRSQGARHAAPPSLPRAAARSHRAPSPEYRPAAPAPIGLASSASRPSRAVARIASTSLRAAIRIPLCRHRADSALIAPHHDHRAPPPSYTCCASPSASRPPCADIRVTPPSLSSRCGGPRALAGKNRAVCIPFSPNARKRPLSWQHPPEMHAFRDQDGNILAPCIHSRAQSGDSGCMARESCRQGPFSASRSPKSRMARRCCQRRPAFPRQRHAAWPNGLCAMRQRHATRSMAERALRPAARAWPACRMRPPLSSRPRSSPPSYTRRASPPALCPPRLAIRQAAHCGRGEPPIGLFLPPSCCPRRRISPPARRTHPASRADPPRPGNKRNNANNSMRA